jgi:citrate/tricarballylate utilization protein
MRNLAGGHGEGCNFEDEDRFSQKRRGFHQLVMYGFLLCFAATSAGTILHYVFDAPAPYGPFSLPKLFGVPGGVMLCIGALGLLWLKASVSSSLQDERVRGGEFGFVLLLLLTGASGLALYFLLMPYSKMAHGFYRLAALIRDEQGKRR